jgi:hypothetical protein
MNPTPFTLTSEQREKVLTEIHQRQILERQAVAEEQQARQQQVELEYRQSLAQAARRTEEERKQRLLDNLTMSLKLIQEALEAFQQNDERKTYVLLVRADPFFITAKHQLNQTPERPSGVGLPTLKVKANNPLGFAIVNTEDFIEGVHQLYEEGTK